MKSLLFVLLAMLPPLTVHAAGAERMNMVMWHLRPATDVVTTYSARCAERVYTFTFTLTPSPQTGRADNVGLVVQDGATTRQLDLTATVLGQLLTDPTGFGELRFACRPT
ncbi:hypothetical protein ACG02S_06840 [Roseateles sp. DC23W]|uniref:Uncharacterized protein n=1 Tax=Pelomonas dachongensis TaxID=3299029 RepID=A0ABW7ELP3_9BURK